MASSLVKEYYSPTNGVSQPEVDRAYVLLERTGFAVDTEFFAKQEKQATIDREKVLEDLRKHYDNFRENSKPPEEIDDIWTSPKQMLELLHDRLGLEPSPIWQKGEVRDGERKADQTALKYLAAANPRYRAWIEDIIHLKRINSSLKYLRKIPKFIGSDGFIHPIYGADSDDSESTGANSGRSVMKSPEGHQIPNSKEKDPYLIRRGFTAPPGWTLVVRDYAAMEAVLLHAICLALFNDNSLAGTNDPNINFHSINARTVFGKELKWDYDGKPIASFDLEDFEKVPYLKDRRRDAKTVFYGLQFCKGARGFGYTLLNKQGEPIGEKEAKKIVDGFYIALPGVKKFQDWVFNYLLNPKENFMCGIAGFSGRWRNVDDLVVKTLSNGKVDSMFRKAWRQCCNHPEQEGGAAIKTTALVHLQRELKRNFGNNAFVQNEIHDEFVVRCIEGIEDEVGAVMQDCMENTFELPCGVKLRTAGSKGPSWYDAK